MEWIGGAIAGVFFFLLLLGLLLLLLVFLTPIRYRLSAQKEEERLFLLAEGCLLGRLLSVRACYEEGKSSLRLFLFFWELYPGKKRRKAAGAGAQAGEKKSQSELERIREAVYRIAGFLKKEENRTLTVLLWEEATLLWKKLRPEKLSLHGVYGLEDPALTGLLTGALSLAPLWYPEEILVQPDFTREVLQGEAEARGRLFMWQLAGSLGRLLRKEPFRRAVQSYGRYQKQKR